MTVGPRNDVQRAWRRLALVLVWAALAGVAGAACAQTAAPAAPAASAAAATSPAATAPTAATAATAATVSQSFAELEAAGVRIGTIRVVAQDIFDTADPLEDKMLFRWANAVHIQTRTSVIERSLLFKSGDPVNVVLIDETERLLRNNRFIYDVQFRVVAVHDGVVDIDVLTRDTWSLDPGFSAGRTGGATSSGIHLREYNLLGTGVSLGIGRSRNVDRTSNEFQFSNTQFLGTRAALSVDHATNSDGRSDAVALMQPFYALDSRWAAGASASKEERVDAVYDAGVVDSQYRHWQNKAQAFGGWSDGLVDGWVRRYSLGLNYQADTYAPDPGQPAPARLPGNEKLVGPFVRFEWIENRYEREINRNLIGRPEFFALGFASTLELGWAGTDFGSSRDAWLYSGTASRGFEPWPDHRLIAAASILGQLWAGQVRRQHAGAQAQYYLPQSSSWLFFGSASGEWLTHPDAADLLLLGGDNGLRGYPLRYQSGTRRALFTFEERFYTDLYVWRLFRIGGAAFLDVGRAWGGDQVNTTNPGWLGNAGMGLRIVSARAAFGNVLHVDVAFPLYASPDVRRVQFLVRSKTSF